MGRDFASAAVRQSKISSITSFASSMNHLKADLRRFFFLGFLKLFGAGLCEIAGLADFGALLGF